MILPLSRLFRRAGMRDDAYARASSMGFHQPASPFENLLSFFYFGASISILLCMPYRSRYHNQVLHQVDLGLQ